MASIHLLEGKKQLVRIQVALAFPGSVNLLRWARATRRALSARLPCLTRTLTVTSILLLICLLLQLLCTRRPSPNDFTDPHLGSEELWAAPEVCSDCKVKDPMEISKLEPNLLLVLIHARASDSTTRDAIRKTWLSDFQGLHNSPVQYRFVIGGKHLPTATVELLLKESEKHRDLIILSTVTDSHATLTRRTIDSFSFTVRHFEFSYLLKCDDDTFVDLPRLASELQQRRRRDRLYWGYMVGTLQPKLIGRYRETRWNLCDAYLPYALGGGYVLSRDLVELLVRNRPYLKQYKCEDVSVGAWLAPYNIERRHDSRFDTESRSRGCKDVFLVSHRASVEDMYSFYQSLQFEGVFCSWRTQWSSRSGYLYNWTASPSRCCYRTAGVP